MGRRVPRRGHSTCKDWRSFGRQESSGLERASGRAGASGGPAAWPAGSGPASPPARGPPGHRRGRLGGASLAPPAVVEAAGHLMGRQAEFRGVVPAALMCGRPARRQLVPPRRPRATIDTHQAAAAGSTPSPGRLCRSFRGLPSRAGGGALEAEGAPAGPPLLSAARAPRTPLISLCPSAGSGSPSTRSLRDPAHLRLCLLPSRFQGAQVIAPGGRLWLCTLLGPPHSPSLLL